MPLTRRGSVRALSVSSAQGETSLAKDKKTGIEGVAALQKTKKKKLT